MLITHCLNSVNVYPYVHMIHVRKSYMRNAHPCYAETAPFSSLQFYLFVCKNEKNSISEFIFI